MKIPETLKQNKKSLFSFELLPPLKGRSIKEIYDTIDPLMEFKPPYINITYHREEVVYKKRTDGLLEKKTIRKRPGTVAIAAAIKYKYRDINVVPHLICGGFSKEETENALIDLSFLGIENILLLRGDPEHSTNRFVPEKNGHHNALGLINQVSDLNNGIYLDEELENSSPTDFTIGVAGYPEKHIESPNDLSDLHFLKKKVEAGAEFIVTQMFFDNQKYYNFVNACRKEGITVPIIPGIKPISVQNHLNSLPKTFNIDLPEALVKELIKCKDNSHVRQLGIEWAIAQSKDLIKNNVPVIHYYTMGKPDNVYKIAKAVF
ncbi:MAG: methylenetetrahydrofolate reductase [NAD(P)H] [Bacteroidetes bacterium 4572_112]|nr:MAG: methylenetetrahydrofolate reductase [NAD(P)H] [Bacteroidetes bacterium 4572_112]